MFTNFAHFKKATQVMFKETCSNGMKLSQYRDFFAQTLGYSNTQSIKKIFESQADGPQIVSVIIYCNDTVHSKHDFYDNAAGNEKANELFRQMLKEYHSHYNEEDIEDCIDNGYFDDEQSHFQIFITHSY